MARSSRRAALRTIASGAVGAATSTLWAEPLSAFALQQAHAHAADAAIAAQDWTPRVFTPSQNALVIALTELIIPATDTPGASAARVNRFIDSVLHDAQPAHRAAFLNGLSWIDNRSRTLYKKDFVAATASEQTALLTPLADEQQARAAAEPTGREFFQAVKFMTIDGYYTSEIGLRRELGDSGQLFLAQFAGCDHPEHQG